MATFPEHGIQLGDQTRVVLQSFRRKGIAVNRSTIARIRSGDTNGLKLERKLELTELLEGNVAKKDTFYENITAVGLANRKKNRENRYTPYDFMESIAAELQIHIQELRRAFRCMRIDLALASETEAGLTAIPDFVRAAQDYFAGYLKGRSVSPAISALENSWDHTTIPDFYQRFYETITRPTSAQTWPPYEVEALHTFYSHRLEQDSPPTPFDRLAITASVSGAPLNEYIQSVRTMTGIKFDGHAHYAHMNILVDGEP